MKNITLSVCDDVHRKARLAAAKRDISASALLAELLEEVGDRRPRHHSRAATIAAAFDAVIGFSASDRLTRDQSNDRILRRELEQRGLLRNGPTSS